MNLLALLIALTIGSYLYMASMEVKKNHIKKGEHLSTAKEKGEIIEKVKAVKAPSTLDAANSVEDENTTK